MKPKKMITAAQDAWLNELGVDTHWLVKQDIVAKQRPVQPTQSQVSEAPASAGRLPAAGEKKSANIQPMPDLADVDSLSKLYDAIKSDLDNSGVVAHAVFGNGQEQEPQYMFIGEQPGLEDSAIGQPFAGDQAQLLAAIFKAVKLPEAQSRFMTNLIKYRLPNGAEPDKNLIERFLVYLKQEIALVQPKNIIALGSVAASALLNGVNLKELRGQQHFYQPENGPQIPLWISHQPMALLVHGARKDQAWRDFVAIAKHNNL